MWILVTKSLPEKRNNFGYRYSFPSSCNRRLEPSLSCLGDLEVIWGSEFYECRFDRQLPITQVGKASNEVLATFLSGMIRKPRMTASAL